MMAIYKGMMKILAPMHEKFNLRLNYIGCKVVAFNDEEESTWFRSNMSVIMAILSWPTLIIARSALR